MPTPNAFDADDKDLPLREDIRLLGRILGDTVREQKASRLRHRRAHPPKLDPLPPRRGRRGARGARATLNALPRSEAMQIIRAFGFFSHLANIAEDQHHIRRTRAHALRRSAPREGTMAHAWPAPREAGIPRDALRRFLRRRDGRAGADRASDRGAAQEHDRPRDGGRRSAGRARPLPLTPEELAPPTRRRCAAPC